MPQYSLEDRTKLTLHEYLINYTPPGPGVLIEENNSRAATEVRDIVIGGGSYPVYVNEFWTSRQRQAASIHEISYRACFKPQLPRFFIDLLTTPGDLVYDPFSGRGTTVIEAALQGRRIIANDANPLSRILTEPRLSPPETAVVRDRLASVPKDGDGADIDLSMFYHHQTAREIAALRSYLIRRRNEGEEDTLDRWIAMVATNRLTGHSPGFFSVYTLPPNQAITPERQKMINERLGQNPPCRDTHGIILKKTRSLLRNLTFEEKERLRIAGSSAVFLNGDARETPEIPDDSVQLTVTSPPFLDIVRYPADNWLRCWFNGIDEKAIAGRITMARTVHEWSGVMGEVFRELYRITRSGGRVAFEVGEVRKGTIRLEEQVILPGLGAGFTCEGVLVNTQRFTKTSHIWGVGNNASGTNTNRVVLLSKP